MQLEIITLSEVRQTPTPHDIAYLWNLNCDSKEPVWNAERRTDPEDRLAAAQGQELGDGWSGESGSAGVSGYVQEREPAKSYGWH